MGRTPRSESELREELVRFSKWLSRLGFMPGTAGNLSARLDEERLIVTPTGMSKFLLEPADMVIVDLEGRLLSGTRKVTSEVGMHLAIYEVRHDISAVIHSHPPIATGFACAGKGLEEVLCQEGVMTLGTVPLATYATTGTGEVAASLGPFVRGHEAILMANHGVVTYGSDLLEAFLRMETVEHLAHIELVAHQLGSARPLSVNQIEQVRMAKARYLQNTDVPNGLSHTPDALADHGQYTDQQVE
ncbi:MAG TPA: class II aldolase/adducin family protein [Acidobacteriaceae bacterium]|jgi:L-fuculose-phosphate aldolase|nr:class II aldolase/adducin family protein [Acidobacteriaceae bacterium]